MSDKEFTGEKENVDRRRFMKALGAGAGIAGFGGIASADDEIEVVDVELLTDQEAAEQLEIALQYDYVGELADFIGHGSLNALPEQVWGHRIWTNDEEFNARDPVVISVPYAGEENEIGFYWTVVFDDGGDRGPTAGLGTTVEAVDGEYVNRLYGYEADGPAIVESKVVEHDPELSAQFWCSSCVWAIGVVCDYQLYRYGSYVCGWICWSSSCERACDALIDYLGGFVCWWFDEETLCRWAGFC